MQLPTSAANLYSNNRVASDARVSQSNSASINSAQPLSTVSSPNQPQTLSDAPQRASEGVEQSRFVPVEPSEEVSRPSSELSVRETQVASTGNFATDLYAQNAASAETAARQDPSIFRVDVYV